MTVKHPAGTPPTTIAVYLPRPLEFIEVRLLISPASGQRRPPLFHRGPFPAPHETPRHLPHKNRYLREKKIPKGKHGSGKFRTLLVPSGPLRELQDTSLNYLTSKDPGTDEYPFALFDCHTAFKRGASALKNAQRHEGYALSVKFDIKNFFDSIPVTPRRSRRVAAFYRKLLNPKQTRKGRRRKCKFAVRVACVHDVLTSAGVPGDISGLISDAAGFRGYLYQGSPLSPMLANLVTKSVLCPRLLKLATVYDLPIFSLRRGKKHLVVDLHGKSIWHYGFEENDPDLEFFRVVSKEHHAWDTRKPKPVPDGIAFEEMTMEDGEDLKAMLLRYGHLAWCLGASSRVSRLRRFYVRRIREISIPKTEEDYTGNDYEDLIDTKGTVKVVFSYQDLRINPIAKTVFTLYADDGMFSSNNKNLYMIKYVIRRVLECSGFRLNSKKGVRVMRTGRYVTGYEVSDAPEEALDKGARLPWKHRDVNYRRPLHHMRVGRLSIDEEIVQSFNGKLAYLKQSNPVSWARYAKEFYDLVMEAGFKMEPSVGEPLADMVKRYEDL